MVFTQILNQNADFQRLYRKGAFCSLGQALLYVMPNGLGYNRLGITAGKKIGNAVKRSRAKRIIRAAYTAAEMQLPIGVDLVIVARSGLPEQKSDILTAALMGRGMRHIHDVSSGKIKCQASPQEHKRKKRSPAPRKQSPSAKQSAGSGADSSSGTITV